MLINNIIHTIFNFGGLRFGGCGSQKVIAFAFFALNVVDARTLAAEESYHRLIEDMLCGMRRRKFGLIMGVEDGGCFHSVYILFAKIV
jgi:hypothetical protein